MADLEKLIVQHAYWSDVKNGLRKLGAAEAAQCVRLNTPPQNNCFDFTVNELSKLRDENPSESISFDDVWDESDPCEHCIAVRRLRAERIKASKHLGAVRAAMTMAGRRLIKAGAKV